jgi:hypothetical protein
MKSKRAKTPIAQHNKADVEVTYNVAEVAADLARPPALYPGPSRRVMIPFDSGILAACANHTFGICASYAAIQLGGIMFDPLSCESFHVLNFRKGNRSHFYGIGPIPAACFSARQWDTSVALPILQIGERLEIDVHNESMCAARLTGVVWGWRL